MSRPRVLAVASGGGHWMELLRLRPAFDGATVSYLTVRREYADEVPGHPCYIVNDATRWSRLSAAVLALRVLLVMLRARPDVVVTTGAAPGYFAVWFGRWLGARTVWLDSLANEKELSMSGRLAGRRVDLWLTQWPHLAREGGPFFAGSVL